MTRTGWALLGLIAAVGCGSSYDYVTYYSSGSYGVSTASSAQPDLALSDHEIEARLLAAQSPVAAAPAAAPETLAGAAEALRGCYERRDAAQADALLAAHEGLLAWDEAGGLVEISSQFQGDGVGGAIELTVRRPEGASAQEALAIAFPPGTYGLAPGSAREAASGSPEPVVGSEWTSPESERHFGTWPKPQDLALLRAPVVELAAGEQVAKVRVPVACASFHRGAPKPGTVYALDRFERGSQADRLMQAICAGARPPAEAEVQLAVWLARDDVSWDQFQAEGGHWGRLVTFGAGVPVLPGDARGAAELMLDAGIDPRPLRFFGGEGSPDVQVEAAPAAEEPAEQAPAAPEPEPEPQAEPEPSTPGDLS
jgi:hypothetical protein